MTLNHDSERKRTIYENVSPESVFLLTRRVFAESVFAESVLLSQLFADAARIVVDRQFIDVNIDRGGTA